MSLNLQKLSICLCTYNGEDFIRKQLESILSQKNFELIGEIIICDDCSDDSTSKIIKKIAIKNRKIKFIKNKYRLGVKKNFEKCLALTKFPIIALCDQDDMWSQFKVKKIMNNQEVLKTKPMALIHNAALINSDDKVINNNFMKQRGGFSSSIFKNFYKNSYLGCCLVLNSSLKKEVLPFPKFLPQHDIWIGIVASLSAETIFLDENLTFYRRHTKNVSNASKNIRSNYLKVFKFRLMFLYCILVHLIRKLNNLYFFKKI